MPVINCLPGVWTAIPDLGGDQVVEAREKGLYMDTTGGLTIAEAAQGYALCGGEARVISAAVAALGARVTPANPIKAASVRYDLA